jgi:hypothetical protein
VVGLKAIEPYLFHIACHRPEYHPEYRKDNRFEGGNITLENGGTNWDFMVLSGDRWRIVEAERSIESEKK